MSDMKINNFELISALKAHDRINVRKYRSSKTGLTVVLAYVPGPLVNGYFTLATEAHDDDGLPHTLEHLIFLGSEDYPYKGVLDLLANRNLASGTNAWTDTDHTCYTMTTAGSEGFLNLMPVYIDHILYPTLTDAGFVTEVHHITGEGQDAGVVYCEMQSRENSGESRVHLEMLRAIYPGRCGYKSETGGLMKNLRESTDNVKVRQYHKDFYRPENLSLIIVGQVEDQEVLNALSGVERKILSKGPQPPFQRPWQTPVLPLEKSVDIVVPYAADEEDNGMVYVAWRGPSCVNQVYEMSACSILLRYLTDTSISPLQLEFVEIADPVASSVSYSLLENAMSVLYIMLENVPIAKLGEVKPRLDAKLRDINAGLEKFDLDRMHAVLNRQKLESLLNLETQPHSSIAFTLIADTLYGSTEEHLEQRLNSIRDLERMAKENSTFWLQLLDKYLVSAPSITVRGRPSIAEQAKLAQEEEMRVSEQVERLGPEGLKKKGEELVEATAINDRPPPLEMLTSQPIPDPSLVHFHKIETFSTNSENQPKAINLEIFPLYTDVHGATTNFIYMMILMDTSGVPDDLRMYLPLYLASLLESPVRRNGEVIPHQTVVGELEKDTISTTTSLGMNNTQHFSCGPYSETATLVIQVEPNKYEKGVRWLHELLYCIQFNAERLSIVAAKMINEVAEFRRNGRKVAGDLLKDLDFKKNCNKSTSNMVRQHQFLSKVGKELCNGGKPTSTTGPLVDIEKLRKFLTRPSNVSARVALNLETVATQVPDLTAPWRSFLPSEVAPSKQKLKVTRDHELLELKAPGKRARILGMGSVESAYLCQSVPCVNDYLHPDLPALYVFLQYLTQLEGPMWKQIRGLGFSYGYNMVPHPNEGLLHLYFSKATNVLGAYKEAKKIIQNHLQKDCAFDLALLASAKSSMMYEIISLEGTVSDAIIQSVFTDFKGVPSNFNRELVRSVAAVTVADLKQVGQKYVPSLFDPNQAKTSIVCHPSKVEEISKGFKELGFEMVILSTLNEVFV